MSRSALQLILTDDLILEQLQLAESELRIADSEVCLGPPQTALEAFEDLNPSGYCDIGWVWSRRPPLALRRLAKRRFRKAVVCQIVVDGLTTDRENTGRAGPMPANVRRNVMRGTADA
jgi:hypothetical protein